MGKQAAGLVLVHEATQRLLVVSKHSEPDEDIRTWQLPKGRQSHVQEPLLETALRETSEETGLAESKVYILHDLQEWLQKTPFGNVTFFAATWLSSMSAEWWPVADADIKWARWMPISQIELQVRPDQVFVAREMVTRALLHLSLGNRWDHQSTRHARSRTPVMRRSNPASHSPECLGRPTPPPVPPTRMEYQAYHARQLQQALSSPSHACQSAPEAEQALVTQCGSECSRVTHPSPQDLVTKVNLKARQSVAADVSMRVPPTPPPRPLPPPVFSGLKKLWANEHEYWPGNRWH